MTSYITTLHALIKDLEKGSSLIGSMALAQQLQDSPLANDLGVFANQDEEKALINFALERLVTLQLYTIADSEKSTRELIQEHNFYGAFFELATYGWMLRHGLHFQPQVLFNPPDILNAKPCTLDGVLTAYDTAFDIKAFGLAPYLLETFIRKLQAGGLRVTVDGPVDVDVKTVQRDALDQLKPIAAELRNKGAVTINSLRWEIKVIKGRPPVVSSTRTSAPYNKPRN